MKSHPPAWRGAEVRALVSNQALASKRGVEHRGLSADAVDPRRPASSSLTTTGADIGHVRLAADEMPSRWGRHDDLRFPGLNTADTCKHASARRRAVSHVSRRRPAASRQRIRQRPRPTQPTRDSDPVRFPGQAPAWLTCPAKGRRLPVSDTQRGVKSDSCQRCSGLCTARRCSGLHPSARRGGGRARLTNAGPPRTTGSKSSWRAKARRTSISRGASGLEPATSWVR